MMETRTLLLDLGEKAIRTRGFAGFSYADLARDAGIRKASIHHHFPKKADLALALIERYADNLDGAFSAIRTEARTAGEALNGAIALYRGAIDEGSSACLCAALATDTALLSDAARAALEETNATTSAWFEDVFTTAQTDKTINAIASPKDEAVATLAQLQGAQLLAKAAGTGDAFDNAVLALQSRIIP
ncbi:MAG: TetR/AcrR family transcriptional regulator [Erythrobacter sp.]